MACYFNGQQYSSGAIVCQEGKKYRCREDEWYETGEPCEGTPDDQSDDVDLFSWFHSLPEKESSTEENPVVILDIERWALTRTIYRVRNEIHGRWATSKGMACGNQGNSSAFFYVEDIIRATEDNCADRASVTHVIARPVGVNPDPADITALTPGQLKSGKSLLRPASASVADNVRPHDWNLTGNWICTDGCQKLGGRAKIIQTGKSLQVWNEVGHSADGFVEDATTIRVPGFTDAENPSPNGMRARVGENGTILSWSSQTRSRWVKDE